MMDGRQAQGHLPVPSPAILPRPGVSCLHSGSMTGPGLQSRVAPARVALLAPGFRVSSGL